MVNWWPMAEMEVGAKGELVYWWANVKSWTLWLESDPRHGPKMVLKTGSPSASPTFHWSDGADRRQRRWGGSWMMRGGGRGRLNGLIEVQRRPSLLRVREARQILRRGTDHLGRRCLNGTRLWTKIGGVAMKMAGPCMIQYPGSLELVGADDRSVRTRRL